MKQSVLICGATGFIGRNLVEHFATTNGCEIHAVWHRRPSYEVPGVIWHYADLRNPTQVEQLLQGTDIVIQAAATTSGAKDITSRPYIHVTDNALMNSVLLRSAYDYGVKHFVFFSCTVMYPSSERALREEDFDGNITPRYFGVGWTKVYIEKMCEFYAGLGRTRHTVIRHSNVYGPHDKFDLEHSHVFGATVTKVMSAREKVVIWGKGEEKRDLLHVRDLVRFVDLALERQKIAFGRYNCGLGEAVSVRQLCDRIVAASRRPLKLEHDLSQPSIPFNLHLNCSKAEKELGWRPAISLDEGIRDTLDWWRQNIDSKTLSIGNDE